VEHDNSESDKLINNLSGAGLPFPENVLLAYGSAVRYGIEKIAEPLPPRANTSLAEKNMTPIQQAYYEANKYMASETLKIPFVGLPIVKLNEAIDCFPLAENLSPSVGPVVCQAIKEVLSKN